MFKKIIRLFIITALLMLIPITASQYVDGWGWSGGDYVFAAIMVSGTGALFELGRSVSKNSLYRAGFGMALAAGFMLIWINGAVGIIGNEDNPANLMYLGVLAIGFLAAIMVRFQAPGLARTMFGLALAIALIPVVALIMNSAFQEIPEAVGVVRVFAVNTFFVVLFTGAGLLFRQAGAGHQSA